MGLKRAGVPRRVSSTAIFGVGCKWMRVVIWDSPWLPWDAKQSFDNVTPAQSEWNDEEAGGVFDSG